MKKDNRLFELGTVDTLTIGTELLVVKSDIITIGFPDNKIEITADGDILHNGIKCEVDSTMVKNLEYIFRKLLNEITKVG